MDITNPTTKKIKQPVILIPIQKPLNISNPVQTQIVID